MKLRDFIVTDSIIAELKATDRDGAIRELVTSLAEGGAIPQEIVDEIVGALIKRESNGSTGFGKGVAVPHTKHPKITKMAATVGLGSGHRLLGAGSSAGVQHRAASQPGQSASAASSSHEYGLHEFTKGFVPSFPSPKRDAPGDCRVAG